MIRVYLAGPDVFLPDARDWARRRAAICDRHGLRAVSPLDAVEGEPPEWGDLPEWRAIARRNEAHIGSCAAMIANLSPFRGPGADPGTVFEIGYMRALDRPVFGYSIVAADLRARTPCVADGCGGWRAADGMAVEDFGLFENLMIASALAGAPVLDEPDPMAGFERCVLAAAAFFDRRSR